MIEIKQPVNTTTLEKTEYTSQISEVNKIPSMYREYVDEIYYQFCMHPCEHTAHRDLKQVIQTLQTLLDTSDF